MILYSIRISLRAQKRSEKHGVLVDEGLTDVVREEEEERRIARRRRLPQEDEKRRQPDRFLLDGAQQRGSLLRHYLFRTFERTTENSCMRTSQQPESKRRTQRLLKMGRRHKPKHASFNRRPQEGMALRAPRVRARDDYLTWRWAQPDASRR